MRLDLILLPCTIHPWSTSHGTNLLDLGAVDAGGVWDRFLNSFAAQATKDFLQNQTGPLASGGENVVGQPCSLPIRAFVSFTLTFYSRFEKLPQQHRSQLSASALFDLSTFPDDWPELELLPLAATTATTNDGANYASFTVAVLATTSHGNVTVNSTDTRDHPIASPNWLTTRTDQQLAVQGLKRAREIAAATGITV